MMDDLAERLAAVYAALGDPFRLSIASDGSVGICRKEIDRIDEMAADGPAFAALEHMAARIEDMRDHLRSYAVEAGDHEAQCLLCGATGRPCDPMRHEPGCPLA